MPSKKMNSIKGSHKQYEALKKKGMSKERAAKITNAKAKKSSKRKKR